jgi:membrane protease YdiL (CAAX protease family)
MREALPGSQQASIAAALLFSLVHLPNPLLLITTAVAGYLWCRAFERAPNLFVLAISHAWLVTLLMTSVPKEVHRFLRIGPRYLTWPG